MFFFFFHLWLPCDSHDKELYFDNRPKTETDSINSIKLVKAKKMNKQLYCQTEGEKWTVLNKHKGEGSFIVTEFHRLTVQENLYWLMA